jgi:hypothetical protein
LADHAPLSERSAVAQTGVSAALDYLDGALVAPAAPSALDDVLSIEMSGTRGEALGADAARGDEAAAVAVVAPEARAAPVARVPTAVVVAPAPPPTSCPADWFCYPRVGVSGPIVPYGDCTGASDVGGAIRSLTCLSPHWLAAHAWTQFGRITEWRAGDIVFAYGRSFTITGAITARSCAPAPQPIAPLSMQTSLSPAACGPVLIVQAR